MMEEAIEEVNLRNQSRKEQVKSTNRECTTHEANILASLGDHSDLPLLFGIQTKEPPFCLILQLHGDKSGSLTLWRGASKDHQFSQFRCYSDVNYFYVLVLSAL